MNPLDVKISIKGSFKGSHPEGNKAGISSNISESGMIRWHSGTLRRRGNHEVGAFKSRSGRRMAKDGQ